MMPFQNPEDSKHCFKPETDFDDILNLYVFDRELRILLFDAIERIEIAIRTQIIYQFSIAYGFGFYYDEKLYRDPKIFHQTMENLFTEINRSHEIFLKHFKVKYKSEKYPPSIMAMEVSSFGTLSKLFRNLKMCDAKKQVGREFGMNPYVLESWMQSIAYVRNIVAHHGRIWNRKLTMRPALLKHVPKNYVWLTSNDIASNKIYAFIACLMYLKRTINPGTAFGFRLKKLIEENPIVDVASMGFPKGWEQELLWN